MARTTKKDREIHEFNQQLRDSLESIAGEYQKSMSEIELYDTVVDKKAYNDRILAAEGYYGVQDYSTLPAYLSGRLLGDHPSVTKEQAVSTFNERMSDLYDWVYDRKALVTPYARSLLGGDYELYEVQRDAHESSVEAKRQERLASLGMLQDLDENDPYSFDEKDDDFGL